MLRQQKTKLNVRLLNIKCVWDAGRVRVYASIMQLLLKKNKEGNLDYKFWMMKCVRCAECVNHYTAGCYSEKVLATKKG